MLRIGEFARLAGISVKALRFYSDAGLLRPSRVDLSSGYRSYEAAQLRVLRRIQALKSIGFSLREIALTLGAPGSLRDRLQERRAGLARALGSTSRQMALLDQLLASDEPDPLCVTRRRSDPFRAVGLRDRLGAYEEVEQLFAEAARLLPLPSAIRGRVAAWHASGSSSGHIECEALLVVDDECPGAREFASQEVVSTTYDGDAWHEAYARLERWLTAHRCVLAGPKFEYLLPGGLVEVQFPIRDAPG